MTQYRSLLLAAWIFAECHAQAPSWTQVQPTQSPSERTHHAMAYDSDRQVTVLFGGSDALAGAQADTWEYDGKTWTEIKPAVSPPRRTGHGMIYDSISKLTVLYGGSGLRDTWTWDGKVWTKIKIPAAQKPSARTSFAMAFDQDRGRIVLFGGKDIKTGIVNDTWEFDGTVWTNMTPSNSTSPPARRNHALVYDSHRKRTVLVGGIGLPRLPDTYEWDGVMWYAVWPGGMPSVRRIAGGATYDTARRCAVVFGGFDKQLLNETLEYDGRVWTRITSAQTPRARERHQMVYDSARGRVVMFGGSQNGGETWEYWGATCTMIPDVPSISIVTGGAQTLTIDAGPVHAHRPYWIFGSMTGISPGVVLNGIQIPLNLDIYTKIAMELVTANPPFKGFRSTLDASGRATAQFIVPANAVKASFPLYHSCILFDASGRFYCASNAVAVTLK